MLQELKHGGEKLDPVAVRTVAFGALSMADEARFWAVSEVLTAEWLLLVVKHIARRGPEWRTLLVTLGNTGQGNLLVMERLAGIDGVVPMLREFASGSAAESLEMTGVTRTNIQDTALWIVANLATADSMAIKANVVVVAAAIAAPKPEPAT